MLLICETAGIRSSHPGEWPAVIASAPENEDTSKCGALGQGGGNVHNNSEDANK